MTTYNFPLETLLIYADSLMIINYIKMFKTKSEAMAVTDTLLLDLLVIQYKNTLRLPNDVKM